MEQAATGRIDLYWLPLGAGGNFVRLNGRIYEAIAARLQRRAACDLYHSGLSSCLKGDTWSSRRLPALAPMSVAWWALVPSARPGPAAWSRYSVTSFAAGATA